MVKRPSFLPWLLLACVAFVGGVTVPGVTTIRKAGDALLRGDVTLTAGSNVTLTQSGQNITIASSGGGGGSAGDEAILSSSVNWSIASGSWSSPLAFNTEERDTNTLHDTTTNNERITIATTGSYIVGAHMYIALSSAGGYGFRICVNGATAAAGCPVQTLSIASASFDVMPHASRPVYLTAGDYLTMSVIHTASGSQTVESIITRFYVTKTGAS